MTVPKDRTEQFTGAGIVCATHSMTAAAVPNPPELAALISLIPCLPHTLANDFS